MEENQKKLRKYLTCVITVEEQDDTSVNLICVESVWEKKQMLENFQGLENQVGRKYEQEKKLIYK